MSERRPELPQRGTQWPALREKLAAKRSRDVDWRHARTAIYVFHAGDDVLDVAKEAYALYQSENALDPMAFPSLKQMEPEVVGTAVTRRRARRPSFIARRRSTSSRS